MNEKEKTLPQLTQVQQSMEHKISRATLVADNILTPGWIEKQNSKASRLRLGPDNDPLFENLERAVSIRYRLLAKPDAAILPTYRMRLAEVNLELERKTQETSTKIESFTNDEAAMLGAFIESRNKVLIDLNSHGSFTFELDEEILASCQRLQRLSIPAIHHAGVSREEYEEYIEFLRKKVAEKLKYMLDSQNIDAILDSQENKDVENLLIWLYMQNEDRFLGLLPDFLTTKLEQITQVQIHRSSFSIERIHQIWHPSGEILSKIRKAAPSSTKPDAMRVAELPEEFESITPPSVPIEAPTGPIPYEQPPTKPRIAEIERRDPQVRQKTAVYLDQIAEKGVAEPVTSARLNKEFPRLKETFIENAVEKRYVRPAVNKHGYTVFTPAEIAKLLYISYHSRGGGLTPALVAELDEIIDQAVKAREKEQLYNNHSRNPQ